MPKAEDPEQLLAEALRAQAVRAPLPSPLNSTAGAGAGPPEPGLTASGGLGLLSGNDLGVAFHGGFQDAAETAPVPRPATAPPPQAAGGLNAGWVLLFALVLGLVAGSVAAVLTLI